MERYTQLITIEKKGTLTSLKAMYNVLIKKTIIS